MKKKRFTEEQTVRILQEVEGDVSATEVYRKHNYSEQSFYRWKAKFVGMEVSEANWLRELEKENTELKRMVAEQALDIRMLRDVSSKEW